MYKEPILFRDRSDAGRRLVEKLQGYADRSDVVVLALPRGGVPVGAEVARALHAPLDVFVVRKLGVPGHQELAMGAIASGDALILNDEVIRGLSIPQGYIDAAVIREKNILNRRVRLYAGARPPVEIAGRTVILVDDGAATGATMRVAIQAARQRNPRRIVVAIPTAPPDVCDDIRAMVDETICLMTPPYFLAVSSWYEDFSPTSDEEVCALLENVAHEHEAYLNQQLVRT